MPDYKKTLPDGRVVYVTADSDPSVEEVQAYLDTQDSPAPTPVDPKAARRAHLENVALGDPAAEGERATSTLNYMSHPGDAVRDLVAPLKKPVENLPGILGFMASMGLGGKTNPVAAAAAGMAGVGGAGIRNGIQAFTDPEALKNRGVDPLSAKSMLLDTGVEGVKQAGIEFAGRKVQGLAKAGGHGLVDHAMDPSDKLLKRSPNVVQDFIDANASLSKGGSRALGKEMTAGAEAANAAVAAAPPQHYPITQLTDALLKNPVPGRDSSLDYILKQAEQGPMMNRLTQFEKNVATDHGPTVDLQKLHTLTRSAGDRAAKVWEGTPHADLESKMHADLHSGGQAILDRDVPDFKGINDQTQKTGFIKQGVDDALKGAREGVSGFMSRHGLASTGALTGLLGAFTNHPEAGLAAAVPLIASELFTNPTVEAAVGKKISQAGNAPLANFARTAGFALPSELTDWISRYLQEQPTQK
jgi:hypothetical protein